MMMRLFGVMALLFILQGCQSVSSSSSSTVLVYDAEALKVIDPQSPIEILADGFRFTEGPVWVEEGNYLLFSDIPNNVIHRYQPGVGSELWLQHSGATGLEPGDYKGGSNGLLLNSDNELILFQQGDRRVAKLDAPFGSPRARFKTLADNYKGKRLNSPNDGVFHSNGSLYFTDPPYGLRDGIEDSRKVLDFQGIFRLDPDGELHVFDESVNFPNGIALSKDDKTLFVAVSDREQPRWLAYDLDDKGNPVNKRLYYDVSQSEFKGVPDGMVVNSKNYLFATGPGGVWIFSPDGRVLATILTGRIAANCTLSSDEKELYITAHDTLMKVSLK